MRCPNSALALAFLGTALTVATVFAQQSAPAPAGATTTADPGTVVPPGRNPQSLLRNGLDFITYQEYERALVFLREAERRQKELTEPERQKLKQGLDRAQRGLREASVGMSTERAYAKSGRTARPGAMALAKPASGTPDPAIEREPIQLVGGQSASDSNPNAANVRATMPAPGIVPEAPAPLPPSADLEPARPARTPNLPMPSAAPAPLPDRSIPVPLPEPPTVPTTLAVPTPAQAPSPEPAGAQAAPSSAAAPAAVPTPSQTPSLEPASTQAAPSSPAAPTAAPAPGAKPAVDDSSLPILPPDSPAVPAPIPLPEPATDRPLPITAPKPAAEHPPLPALPTDLTDEPPATRPAAPDAVPAAEAPAVPKLPVPPVTERVQPDPSERSAETSVPMPNRSSAAGTAPEGESLPVLPDALSERATPTPASAAAPPPPMPAPAAEGSASAAASSDTAPEPPAPSLPMPGTAPTPTPTPTPTPEPPAADPYADSPPAPEAPLIPFATPTPIHTARDSLIPVRPGMAPSSLSPELQREVERIGRLFDEEMQRNPVQTTPPVPVDDTGAPGSPASTRLEISRAPSPTEARPIRAIPVPEEFVLLPKREWDPNRKYWAAAATCHYPLYFQDAALERYGYSIEQHFGPIGKHMTIPLDDPRQSKQRNQVAQPFYSAGLFALQIVALPYNMLMDPPWESEYDLGYYRPGDRVPTDVFYLPLMGIGPPLQGNNYGVSPSPSPSPSRW